MWHKINQLSRENLSQTQIALELGICRDTVRHYQRMSESEFREHISREVVRHPRKLDEYADFIADQLHALQFLSAPQIHDRLKEHFPDLPDVSERTVYSMVKYIRERENLPKTSEPVRQMSRVPESEYGEKAQVDYGEKWLRNSRGRQVKVYFFLMVLQRSKYKFVYFQNVPFTARTTVYAHHLAFQYFGGMPRKVIYDQDRKMLVNENYGDYKMTEEFSKYVAEAGYEPVFCMPADPQSKGLCEVQVKYVKNNFLPGRVYTNIECLNEQALGWLQRTGNAKPNSSTKLVPADEFQKERPHLLPYRVSMEQPEMESREYNVRKDNTLSYRGNFYSLPLGTYSGPGSKVLVVRNVDLNEISIHNPEDFSLITRYEVSSLKGRTITKDGHAASKSRDILESEKILRVFFNDWAEDGMLSVFLDKVRKDRPRYYHKTVSAMASLLTEYDVAEARKLLASFLERGVYNANTMKEMAASALQKASTNKKSVPSSALSSSYSSQDLNPERRSINEYKRIVEPRS